MVSKKWEIFTAMGTVGAPQPSSSSSSSNSHNFVDCSHVICSIDCPQWCSYFLPPPPPFDYDEGGGSGSRISPLMVALISVLASAFLLLTYYTVVSKYCKRRRNRRRIDGDQFSGEELEARLDQLIQEPTSQQRQQALAASTGLDDRFIKSIAVFKYRRGDGLIEGTDCAVCLNEFKEEESLRLMPNCQHAFHLPCIDTWLKSHSNCPLCRSAMIDVPQAPPPPPPPPRSRSGNVNVSAMRIQNNRSNDVVVIVRDSEVIVSHDIPASNSIEGDCDSSNNTDERDDEMRKEGIQR
ncbi:hypothetical protein Ancab_037581 [Ancistrocladus abbreviatus]